MPQAKTLRQRLAESTHEAAPALTESLDRQRVRCLACGHRCRIPEGHDGVCKVRTNDGGTLRVPWGYVAGLAVDPIEKKPFFHVLPGEPALSFGMLGCDLHCAYCQNWFTSQTLRDPRAEAPMRAVSPEAIVAQAVRSGSRVLVSTYNEPLITAEWAHDVFTAGREQGLMGAFVSNGNATPEVLDYLRPVVQAYKVDLKSFRDRNYRALGGVLANVLHSLEGLVARDYWVEVVTLVVPGFNDDEEELRDIARFLAGLGPDVPWHVTGFVPQYEMDDAPATPAATLERARTIGHEEGLRYVYTGNRPGSVDGGEDTTCPSCGTTVVRRQGFRVISDRLVEGRCPDCARSIPGIWEPL